MKLWGVVAEVNEKDLVISLPGGLRGLVRAADALDSVLSKEVEVHLHINLFLGGYSYCWCYFSFHFSYLFLTRIMKEISSKIYSTPGSWFLALCCSWMMIRRRLEKERYGFPCVSRCCTKASPWMLFKKGWYVN